MVCASVRETTVAGRETATLLQTPAADARCWAAQAASEIPHQTGPHTAAAAAARLSWFEEMSVRALRAGAGSGWVELVGEGGLERRLDSGTG